MSFIFRPSWWVSMFVSTLTTMIFIYLIKKVTKSVNIPFVSTIVEEV